MTETAAPKKAEERPKWIPWAIGIALVAVAVLAYFMLTSTGAAVPDVVGMTAEAAKTAITDAGFEVGSVEETEAEDADAGTVVAQDPEAGSEAEEGSKIDLVIVGEDMTVEVPDVTGMTEDEAEAAIEEAGLTPVSASNYVDGVDEGLVAAQLPEAGEGVAPLTEVGILVSLGTGPGQNEVKVPDVTGKTESDAVKTLTGAALTVRTYRTYDENVPTGQVMGQMPEAGTMVPSSSTVAIMVSSGPAPESPTPPEPSTTKVPDVTGMSQTDAMSALQDAGLSGQAVPVYSEDVEKDIIAEQFPAADTEVLLGSAVAIVVSQGPESGGSVVVPDVVGKAAEKATADIEAAGLVALPFTTPTEDGIAEGTVIAQLPQADSKVDAGSPVLILIASGETGPIDPLPILE